MKKSLLYLFAFVVIQFVMSWIIYVAWLLAAGNDLGHVLKVFAEGGGSAVSGPMIIGGGALAAAAAIAIFVWRRWAQVSPAYLRTRQWGVFFWCAVAAVGTLIPSVWMQEQLPQLPDMAKDTYKAILENHYGYFVLCLLVPFAEELVFRGAILRSLLASTNRHWVAILISAAMFAVVHVNPVQMPHAFLAGLLFGWMYYRTGSILPGVVVHWVNNSMVYIIYKLMPQVEDMTLLELFGGNSNSVVLSIVFSLFIFLPAIYQLNMRMK